VVARYHHPGRAPSTRTNTSNCCISGTPGLKTASQSTIDIAPEQDTTGATWNRFLADQT
jgi:hypothetical protein